MKTHPILHASNWTREDGGIDIGDKVELKGLALNYSSSGCDDIFWGSRKQERKKSQWKKLLLLLITGEWMKVGGASPLL